MLHNCVPPRDLLQRWLHLDNQQNGNYSHLLIEEVEVDAPQSEDIAAELRPYFESAHLDARDVFHRAGRIDLHPDAQGAGHNARYPQCLEPTAKRGLFGEVMAGMMAEAIPLIEHHDWTVPIFLFRFHAEVGAYIHDLAREPGRRRQVSGRHGNDFIALGIDPISGEVVRFLAGEAKWRASLTQSVADGMMYGEWVGEGAARVRANNGVWNELSRGLATPQGLAQMHELLCARGPDQYAEAILSLDRALMLDGRPLPRIDYVLMIGDRSARRVRGTRYLPANAAPPEYTAGRSLQIIELVFEARVGAVDRLYDSLWERENG